MRQHEVHCVKQWILLANKEQAIAEKYSVLRGTWIGVEENLGDILYRPVLAPDLHL